MFHDRNTDRTVYDIVSIPDFPRRMLGPTHDTVAERTQTFTVSLGSWTYSLVWTIIYTLHVACAAYCLGSAVLFYNLHTSKVAYYLDLYQVTLSSKYSRTIGLLYFIIGGLHSSFPIVASIRFVLRVTTHYRRRVAVQPVHPTITNHVGHMKSIIPDTIERRTPRSVRRSTQIVYKHVFSRTGVFGIEFQYFEAFAIIREVVETVLQSLQAYQMCQLLARPILNRFFVALLVINCWTIPLLHTLITSKPLQRLLTRLSDVILDFVASVGVPLILIISYIQVYDPTTGDFPYELWYNDKWFVTALKESPMILFGSWLDAVSRLMFSVSLIITLEGIKGEFKRRPDVTINSHTTNEERHVWTNEHHSRTIMYAHRLMFMYGFVVLGLQVHAELRLSPMESCVLKVRPWGVTKPACSLVEVNCWRNRTLAGNANDFDRHVGTLDPLSLAQITFRHCQHIEMQSSLEHFHNLIGIKFYNSTVVSWDDDAALREIHHAKMRYIFFVRTRFRNATLPAGMISREYPRLLQDVEFSVTNLHSIPDDLDQRWPSGMGLILELSELTTYPSAFARIQFDSLTLNGNAITSLPAVAFETPGLHLLSVSGNPITELPTDVTASRVHFKRLEIESTNISCDPSWVGEWLLRWPEKFSVVAGRTPWCEEVVLVANATVVAEQPWLMSVKCENNGPNSGIYPLEVDVRRNEIW